MAAPLKEIGSTAAKAAGTFRDAIQDLLVPELRSLKVSMEGIRTEMQLRDERQTVALQSQGERQTAALQAQGERLTQAIEALTHEVRLRDENQSKAMASLSQKLDFAIDIRERLAHVEARLPKQ